MENLQEKTLCELAGICCRDWSAKGKGIYFGAKPYLEAMECLGNISEPYGADSGKSIVAYFLANAQTWKGEVAKAVKAELNRRLKAR
jgi:hypothetical protein